jgi:hypothetical protein
MKSILDASFRYTSSEETDVRKTFERIWRELRAREKPERFSLLGGSSVRPGRNGGFLDIGWIDAVVIRESVPGIEVITSIPLRGPRVPTVRGPRQELGPASIINPPRRSLQ